MPKVSNKDSCTQDSQSSLQRIRLKLLGQLISWELIITLPICCMPSRETSTLWVTLKTVTLVPTKTPTGTRESNFILCHWQRYITNSIFLDLLLLGWRWHHLVLDLCWTGLEITMGTGKSSSLRTEPLTTKETWMIPTGYTITNITSTTSWRVYKLFLLTKCTFQTCHYHFSH